MKLDATKIDAIADSLTKTVTDLHSDLFETEPKRWNPLAGQYLVYGTEKYWGFGAAAELCEVTERAWRRGDPIKPAILKFLEQFV